MVASDRDDLWFAAPGIAHMLGNALLAVRGHAQLLGLCEPPPPHLPELDQATSKASDGLLLLTWLRGEGGDSAVPFGTFCRVVLEGMRVPLRDHGVVLRWPDQGTGGVVLVHPARCIRPVVQWLREIAARMPQVILHFGVPTAGPRGAILPCRAERNPEPLDSLPVLDPMTVNGDGSGGILLGLPAAARSIESSRTLPRPSPGLHGGSLGSPPQAQTEGNSS